MRITVQKLYRLCSQSQVLQQRIHHTRIGKQTERHGIDQYPADKIRQRRHRLHDIFKPLALNLTQKNCEHQRQHRSGNAQKAHGKRILHNLPELRQLRSVTEKHPKPFQSHKRTLTQLQRRLIIIKSINPTMQRKIRKHKAQDQKRKYHKKHLLSTLVPGRHPPLFTRSPHNSILSPFRPPPCFQERFYHPPRFPNTPKLLNISRTFSKKFM